MCVSVARPASPFQLHVCPVWALTGSEGVSWEEICGVIQPGPLQFEYYTKAARRMGIQSQLPMAKLPELHTSLDLVRHRGGTSDL